MAYPAPLLIGGCKQGNPQFCMRCFLLHQANILSKFWQGTYILSENLDTAQVPFFYPLDCSLIRVRTGVAYHKKLTRQLLVAHCQEQLQLKGAALVLLPEIYILGCSRETDKKTEEKTEDKLFQM